MPRKRDHSGKRAELRHAFAEVIAHDDGGDVPVGVLADKVGMSVPVLYYYFGGKQEMLWSVVSCHIEAMLARLEAGAPDALPPRERVFALARAYAGGMEAHPAEHAITLDCKRYLTHKRYRDARQMQRWLLHVFDAALQAVVGPARRDRAMPLALSLLALLNATMHWLRDGKTLSRDAYAEMAARMVLSEVAQYPPAKGRKARTKEGRDAGHRHAGTDPAACAALMDREG